MRGVKIIKVKCPRCKSNNINLIEVWIGHTITWHSDNGSIDRDDGFLESGDPKHVEGHCQQCDHRWRIRNASQIDDVLI